MPLTNSPTDGDPRRLRLVAENDSAPTIDLGNGLAVAEPEPPLPLPLALGVIAALAAGLFLFLNARRMEHHAIPSTTPPHETAKTAVDLELPKGYDLPPPEPTPGPLPAPAPAPAPFVASQFPITPPAPSLLQQPLRNPQAPALIVDFGAAGAAPVIGMGVRGPGSDGKDSSGEGSLEARALGGPNGGGDRVTAMRLRNPGTVIPQGAVIAAVLETAIDSDLPGFARAVVSQNVLSFDSSAVLIPRGSRLIGQYKSNLVPGQSRVFIVWTRLQRPDGVMIQLDSPGTDTVGRGGLEGKVDRRFIDRFGGSILLTTLNAGLNALSAARSQIVIGGTGGFTPSGGGDSQKAIGPVVKVRQGAPIRVFVARDMDFSTVDASSTTAEATGRDALR